MIGFVAPVALVVLAEGQPVLAAGPADAGPGFVTAERTADTEFRNSHDGFLLVVWGSLLFRFGRMPTCMYLVKFRCCEIII